MEKHSVKYAKYIGDGDEKTFKGILDIDPYHGNPVVIEKECVGHFQKRISARLRRIKKDNKGIGGKGPGKLTDKLINELSLYYGLAIRQNSESVNDMRNKVWATYYHKSSTDENSQHQYCSPSESNWCKWQKAVPEGTLQDFVHENPPLREEVLKLIKPIYENLSSESLLTRCLGLETQNNNELLNSLIWTFAPKHIHAGSHIIEIANHNAVCIFNEASLPVLKIMDTMLIKIGPQSHAFTNRRDQQRINRSEIRASEASKESRTARMAERSANNAVFEVEEGTLYEAGMAD